MFWKFVKNTLVVILMVMVFFSNFPYVVISEMISSYVESSRVVDKMWNLKNSGHVVDNLDPWQMARRLKIDEAEAATAGKMTLYFHKEPSDANETYNSLSFTPPEPAAYTANPASTSTITTNATPATTFCEAQNNAGETYNQIAVAASSTGNRCIATLISPPMGQAFTISTADGAVVSSTIWASKSAVTVTTTIEIYIYRWTGSGTSVVAADRIATFSTKMTGTAATQVNFTATSTSNTINFAATDRVVAIVSANVTAGAAVGASATAYFDNSAAAVASNIVLKYTAITPNKPTLTGSKDDDLNTNAATTACNTTGVVYNTKWTCLNGPATSTTGSFNAGGTTNPTGDSSDWLWIKNQTSATTALPSDFGTKPSNTYLYQSLNSGYGDGSVRTVLNSTGAYTVGATNPATPFSHGGLVLWTSNTDYLETMVYSSSTKNGVSAGTVRVGLLNGSISTSTIQVSAGVNSTTSNGLYGRVWLGFQNVSGTYQAQYSTDGSNWNNLGNPVSHANFIRAGLNAYTGVANPVSTYATAFEWFQHTFVPSSTVRISTTAGNQVAYLNSGDPNQYINSSTCSSAASCSMFVVSSTAPITLRSIKLTEVGSMNANVAISNLKLYYDTTGTNGAKTLFGATSTFTAAETATVTGTLAMVSGTVYYFYAQADMVNGANDPAGGQTFDLQIANNADLGFSNGFATTVGAPASLPGSTVIKPVITGYLNTTESGLNWTVSTCTTCGARIGPNSTGKAQTVVVSGYGFGADPGAGLRSTAANQVSVVGVSSHTVTTTNITAWADRSLTVLTDTGAVGWDDDPSWGTDFGGAGALKITSGGRAVSTTLNFYIFPQITQAPTVNIGLPVDSAREYNTADSDGVVTLNGTRFGTAATGGWVRVLGCDYLTCSSPSGSVTTTAWSNTAITLQIPTVINDNTYTGTIMMQQGTGANSQTTTYSNLAFRILPRITGLAPSSGSAGDAITVNGDHLCEPSGSCPGSFSSSNAVGFYNALVASIFTSWTFGAVSTQVPASVATGNVVVTSSNYVSNALQFTVANPTPSDPTSLNQYYNVGLTNAIAPGAGSYASTTPLYLTMTMQAPVSGGNLYPQVETSTSGSYVCGSGACASAAEGSPQSGPGPIGGTVFSIPNAAGSETGQFYYWRARVRHNKGGSDYYSNWVAFNSAGIAFRFDNNAPNITNVASSSITTSTAVITWNTSGEQSTSQVQYNKTGTFVTDCSVNSDCTPLDKGLVFSHSTTTVGLTSSTVYYYRVRSMDPAGNESISPTYSFKTTSNTVSGYPVLGTVTSVIFDTTASSSGPAYNSITWKGTLGAGNDGRVLFQFATAPTTTGPWNYIGPACLGGSGDWYEALGGQPDTPIGLKCFSQFNNNRYFRYNVQICSHDCTTANLNTTPVVNSVIVNWSP